MAVPLVVSPKHSSENEPGGELLLTFRANRPRAWRASLGLWPLLPGFLLLWGLLRLAFGPANRR